MEKDTKEISSLRGEGLQMLKDDMVERGAGR